MTELNRPEAAELRAALSHSEQRVATRLCRLERISNRFMTARVVTFLAFLLGFVMTAATQDASWGWMLMIPGLVAFTVLVALHRPVLAEIERNRLVARLVAEKLARIETTARPGFDAARSWRVEPAQLLPLARELRGAAGIGTENETEVPEWVLDDLAVIQGEPNLLALTALVQSPLGALEIARRLSLTCTDGATIDRRQCCVEELIARRRARHLLEQILARRGRRFVKRSIAFLAQPGIAREIHVSLGLALPFSVLAVACFVASLVGSSLLLFGASAVIATIGNKLCAKPLAATAAIREATTDLADLLRAANEIRGVLTEEAAGTRVLAAHRDRLDADSGEGRDAFGRCLRLLAALSIYKAGLFYVLFNFLTLYDLYFVRPLAAFWCRRHRQVADALVAISELEAAVAAANLLEELPSFHLPRRLEICESGPQLEIESGTHPLLDPRRSVANSLSLGSNCRAMIVTGANMSGKSTFIRTAGLAVLMAQAGFPVAARSMSWTPLRVMSDINVRDSLGSGESFFAVEVGRVKQILDRVERTPFVLVLLDEVFRGTNTREKVAAGMEVTSWIARHGALAIVATHDHEFTALEGASDAPGARNFHFSDDVRDGKMVFDYVLKPGPAPGRNALRVLEVRGFPREIVERARERAGISEKP